MPTNTCAYRIGTESCFEVSRKGVGYGIAKRFQVSFEIERHAFTRQEKNVKRNLKMITALLYNIL